MHTVKRVCTLVLTGLLALPMAAPAGAAAASFSDLPSRNMPAAPLPARPGIRRGWMPPGAPACWRARTRPR